MAKDVGDLCCCYWPRRGTARIQNPGTLAGVLDIALKHYDASESIAALSVALGRMAWRVSSGLVR